MRNSLYIIFISAFFLLQACLPKAENKSLTYQNIIILSDLSDRINPLINGVTLNQQFPPKT